MRRRLLVSTLAVVVVAVVALAVPLAVLAARQVHTDFAVRLQQQADGVAVAVGERLEDHEPIAPSRLAALAPGRRVTVVARGGLSYVAGPDLDGDTKQATAAAETVTVTVTASTHDEDERVSAVIAVVGMLVAISAFVAVGMTLVQANRLAAPMIALARQARMLGEGHFDTEAGQFGLPEADDVSRVLAGSGRRIGELVDRQRQFARDAAHQLRSPLTAIGLRLEEIATADVPEQVRDDAESALAQVDRLATVVTVLLARARGDASRPRPVQVGELLDELDRHWGPIADRRGRALVIMRPAGSAAATTTTSGKPASGSTALVGLVGLANRDHLGQALAVLLENAVRHGAGTIRIRTVQDGTDVRIEVGDEGAGIPEERVPSLFIRGLGAARQDAEGAGIGLFLARALVEADGGRLELTRRSPPVFAVSIPAVSAPVR
ncbi:sensor histidine kinase [Candidatus Frankia alpina]|uniref:sensor histidine kinase n=1 Tax=Candidatus Frankia alpina TaxID=2699483 RepID=UPI0013D4F8A5|nr:HAMP domain-containing sensor histidine kinase [Candidatus Frankia alpina]